MPSKTLHGKSLGFSKFPAQLSMPAMEEKQEPGSLTIRWSTGERKEIDQEAKQQGIKPTQVIRIAVRQYLDRKKRERVEQK